MFMFVLPTLLNYHLIFQKEQYFVINEEKREKFVAYLKKMLSLPRNFQHLSMIRITRKTFLLIAMFLTLTN